MIWLFLLSIPIVFILIKLILYMIVKKYGKFSYDGFSAAGFLYNSEKDIFYSAKNAWQRNFGYTHLYDVLAPIGRMIVDTEPIRFSYNDKNWLITFWKGQYGIVTGAEIGIYCTKDKKVNKRTVYLPISDKEMLDMSIILYKNNKEIARLKSKHWWLAIFKLGMFSKPKELRMDISITFSNHEMLESFYNSFKKLGHKSKYYSIKNNTFYFKFIKPRTKKVWTRMWLTDSIRQFFNKKNSELYNRYLLDLIDDNLVDDPNDNKKLIMINDLIPNILKNVPDNQNSKEIAKRIINKKEHNVVFLDSRVFPGNKV